MVCWNIISNKAEIRAKVVITNDGDISLEVREGVSGDPHAVVAQTPLSIEETDHLILALQSSLDQARRIDLEKKEKEKAEGGAAWLKRLQRR